jgi:hypothetical protein
VTERERERERERETLLGKMLSCDFKAGKRRERERERGKFIYSQ